ncbi:MAG: hypothetical protein ACOVOR_00650 [Rhabdochlamydiaceae bacterium]
MSSHISLHPFEPTFHICVDSVADESADKVTAEEHYQLAELALKNQKTKEWFDHIELAADKGHPQACQKFVQYCYDTGMLVLATVYLNRASHSSLFELITKELKKIDDWENLPLLTFIYTDTYQPLSKVFCYPDKVQNIICTVSPDKAIFEIFKDVEQVLYEIQQEDQNFEIFLKNKLHTLEKLKIFELRSLIALSISAHNELIDALKQCPLLESLKLNTSPSNSLMSLPKLDLSFFPYLKTLHLNQPTLISNFDKSSLIDLSVVINPSCQTTYLELIEGRNLKNLTSLSLVLKGDLKGILDTSNLENIKTLKIVSIFKNTSIKSLQLLPYLESLDVEYVTFVNDSGQPISFDISSCPNILSLKMKGSSTEHDKIKNLEALSLLNVLNLYNVELDHGSEDVVDVNVLMPSSLLSLHIVSVRSKRVLDLSNCRSLKSIYLSYSSSLNTDSKSFIKGIISCENLNHLTIVNSPQLLSNDEFRNGFKNLPVKLLSLDLSLNNLDDISFIHLSKLVNLKSLELRYNRIRNLPDDLALLPHSCQVNIQHNYLGAKALDQFRLILSTVHLDNQRLNSVNPYRLLLGPQLITKVNNFPDLYSADYILDILGSWIKHRDSISTKGFNPTDYIKIQLESILIFWGKEISKNKLKGFNEENYIKLTEHIKNKVSSKKIETALALFLTYLTHIKNHLIDSNQNNVVRTVYDLIILISENEDALKIIHESLLDYQFGGVLTAFDELQILVALNDDTKTAEEKAKIQIGLHRYKLLQKKVSELCFEKTNNYIDANELILFSKSHLKERLELPICTNNIKHFRLGEMLEPDLNRIGDDILKDTSFF